MTLVNGTPALIVPGRRLIRDLKLPGYRGGVFHVAQETIASERLILAAQIPGHFTGVEVDRRQLLYIIEALKNAHEWIPGPDDRNQEVYKTGSLPRP